MTEITQPYRFRRHVGRSMTAVALTCVLLAACSSDPGASDTTTSTTGGGDMTSTSMGGGGPGRSFTPYHSFESCDELLDWTKERMLERVTPWGLDQGSWWGGRWIEDGGMERAPGEMPAATPAPSMPGDDAGTGSGENTSTTNTQEEGVDEGDLTETDGRFVYTAHDNMLRSVDLDREELVFEDDLRPGDHQLILAGDRLLVVTQDWNSWPNDTVVAVYDVTDGVPSLLGSTSLEGSVLATRGFGDTARVVLKHDIVSRIPFVYPTRGTEASEDAALEENKRVITELTPEQLLPRAFDTAPNGSRGPLRPALDCTDVGVPGDFSGFGLTWVAEIDLPAVTDESDGAGVDGTAGVVADAQTVYASADHLYVGTIRYGDPMGDVAPVRPEPPRTNLHMFDLRPTGGAGYLATGQVEGTVLNQYSLSEHNGFLRVATTTEAGGFGNERDNGVHIFERQGNELVEVGAVRGLGLGESIQGVRFQGDVGYVVTYRQVDPLYVLDLSDPTRPTMEGELKVPGFSTYLHPIGDGLVVAVGMAGTEDGRVTGSQISLFDVSDPSDPTLLDTEDLGWGSEATFDPHAFLWWAPANAVVVPGSRECIDPNDFELGCGNAVVAQVVDGELVRQGELTHWYPIRRSMVAEGRYVTVSRDALRIWNLDTLDLEGEVPFTI
jgi:hypothetical protein